MKKNIVGDVVVVVVVVVVIVVKGKQHSYSVIKSISMSSTTSLIAMPASVANGMVQAWVGLILVNVTFYEFFDVRFHKYVGG